MVEFDQIYSQQHVDRDPHITMVSNVWEHGTEINILTGIWLDGSAYEIQLIDVEG